MFKRLITYKVPEALLIIAGIAFFSGYILVQRIAIEGPEVSASIFNFNSTSQLGAVPPLSVSCFADAATVAVGYPVSFGRKVTGGLGSYSYTWSGSDGITGTGVFITKTFTTPGTKTVNILIKSGAASRSASCSVKVIQKPASWTCGQPLVDNRDGKVYTTGLFGGKCWMTENLNVGSQISTCSRGYKPGYSYDCSDGRDVPQNQGTSLTFPKKFCLDDEQSKCTINGGLYQWPQAMAGSSKSGAQGICPAGWYVPTHLDFTMLERSVCTSSTCEQDFPLKTTNWSSSRGTNEGHILNSLNNPSSLFKALWAGFRTKEGRFYPGGSVLWTSTEHNAISAWYHSIKDGPIFVNNESKKAADSVRCVKS